jgi:hypothetical protein
MMEMVIYHKAFIYLLYNKAIITWDHILTSSRFERGTETKQNWQPLVSEV